MKQRFKDIREAQGRNQYEFAIAAGVSLATVSAFESGRVSSFSPRIRRLLATAYGVPLREFDDACLSRAADTVSAA